LVVGRKDIGRCGQYLWPEVLPGGQTVLFSIVSENGGPIVAYSLQNRRLVPLVDAGIRPRYLPETGHLVYQSEGKLLAAPFDPVRLQLTGQARVVAEQIGDGVRRSSEYDVSRTGVLASIAPLAVRLIWKDRAGTATPLPIKPRRFTFMSLSRDGGRAVLGVEEGTAQRLYIADLKNGEPLTRLTHRDDDFYGVFTPDGSRVFYLCGVGGEYNTTCSVRADGGGEVERIPNGGQPTSIRGPVVLLNGTPISQLRLDRRGSPAIPLMKTSERQANGVFSPDGQWIAYDQSTPGGGKGEVYVQAYPTGSRTQVSLEGGAYPLWNPNGAEVFYRTASAVMAVRVASGVRQGPPVQLFEHRFSLYPDWAVGPDGRFLMVEGARAPEIYVVSNWFEELKRLVPVK